MLIYANEAADFGGAEKSRLADTVAIATVPDEFEPSVYNRL